MTDLYLHRSPTSSTSSPACQLQSSTATSVSKVSPPLLRARHRTTLIHSCSHLHQHRRGNPQNAPLDRQVRQVHLGCHDPHLLGNRLRHRRRHSQLQRSRRRRRCYLHHSIHLLNPTLPLHGRSDHGQRYATRRRLRPNNKPSSTPRHRHEAMDSWFHRRHFTAESSDGVELDLLPCCACIGWARRLRFDHLDHRHLQEW